VGLLRLISVRSIAVSTVDMRISKMEGAAAKPRREKPSLNPTEKASKIGDSSHLKSKTKTFRLP
jgi:hypothetical protein